MGRIRTIKPEFPQSETIGRLSRDARLLFILLWTIADDAGRARASSRMLASLLYPYDADVVRLIDDWLVELQAGGHVRLYRHDDKLYLDIPKWLEHQKIDRPSKSKLPKFDEASRVFVEASTTDLDLKKERSSPRSSSSLRSEEELGERKASRVFVEASRGLVEESDVVDEDPNARLFRIGGTILVSFGIAEKRIGPLLGRWLKQCGNDPVGLLAAIKFAREKNVHGPVAYISMALKGGKNGRQKSGAELAHELAEEWRRREHEQGLFRKADDA